MDNYELEIFIKNLQYARKPSVKKLIESGELSADNIVDILFSFERKLRKVRNLVDLFEDVNYDKEDND